MDNYGADSVLGNAVYKISGSQNNYFYKASNAGNNYVGGNLTLDADNGNPQISFAQTLYVGGSFFGQNFSNDHNIFYLDNLTVNGTGPTGNLQCGAGNIIQCSFKGDFTMLVDSNSNYAVTNNFFKDQIIVLLPVFSEAQILLVILLGKQEPELPALIVIDCGRQY